MLQVTYLCNAHQYVMNPPGAATQVVDRPWVEVVANLNGLQHRVWCLVDTGADDTILDLGTATALGIVPLHLPQSPVVFGNGANISFGQKQISLDFLGNKVHANVLFGAIPVPLLGRSALLQAGTGLQVGFDSISWQHT